MRVTKAITINRPADEVYAFWRDFENLPRFMYHLEMVETIDGKRSHWTAKAPGGSSVEWDAEITEDRPNEAIAWRSIGTDDDVRNSGSVRFVKAPGDRGTEIIVTTEYDPPGGKVGAVFAKLFGEEPSQQIGQDLRRCKQVMEIGEVVRSEGSPEGQGRSILRQHPAQPHEYRSEGEARL
jgi:uncharacterized membrane protein